MTNLQPGEKKFKKGQVLYQAGTFELSMYNIMYGRVGVFVNYGTAEERKVMEMHEGDFLNVISFLESRPRNTTVVALSPTIVHEISFDNFGSYFKKQPAKIMSLLQHMSARMRTLQQAYLSACEKLDAYADKEKLRNDDEEWVDQHSSMMNLLHAMFGSNMGDKQ